MKSKIPKLPSIAVLLFGFVVAPPVGAAIPDNTGSESRLHAESRNPADHDQPLGVLEENTVSELIAGLEERGKKKRMVEFYTVANEFLVRNPNYADSKQREQLFGEIGVVFAADRKSRRIRTLEDVFEIAAQRVDARDLEQAIKSEWQAEVQRFLDAHPVYRADAGLLDAFDGAVRTLGADARNEQRDAQWFLEEAHLLIKSKHPERFRSTTVQH
jgi:hypothetical protein